MLLALDMHQSADFVRVSLNLLHPRRHTSLLVAVRNRRRQMGREMKKEKEEAIYFS